MTLGEKIKYFRAQLGITQSQLADMTGIHPVSIRKYETNKMQPQPAQLEKLASALGVSYNALNGINNSGMRLETVGDLMGVLMVLCTANIIQIIGERDDLHLLKAETVSIKINPVLSSYLTFGNSSSADTAHPLEKTLINIKSQKIFNDLLLWEKMNFLYQGSIKAAAEQPNKATEAALKEIEEIKEKVELELQRSQVLLSSLS